MDCTSIQDLFTAALDNELDPETRVKFNAHISGCKHCALELEHFQTTLRYLKTIEFAQPPPILLANIEEQLHRSNPLRRFCRWLVTANPAFSLPTATATIIVAFACMLSYKNIFLTKQPVDSSARLPIAGYHIQNSTLIAGNTPEQPIRPKAFAFYQKQVLSATTAPGSTFWHEPPAQQNHAINQKEVGPANSTFFNSYIHQYFRQEFVPSQHSDLLITIYSLDNKAKERLHYHLLSEKKWLTKIYNRNIFLLTLDSQGVQSLRDLLIDHHFEPPLPTDLTAFFDSKPIRVAIHLK